MPVINQTNFTEQIEEIVADKDIQYIDAIIHWCEINNFDVEYAGDLIRKNPTLKERIEKEAQSLNFLKEVENDSL
jgi:hypothetical protein